MGVTPARPTFTDAERQRRKKAVDTARASMRLSGFILDDATEAIYARYIDGHLELPEVIVQVRQNAGLEN